MTGETYLKHAMDAIGGAEPKYDSNVKYLLADKQVLARILKYAVEEFNDMTLERLIACINDIEVENRYVDAGETNLGRIQGLDAEDNVPNEGKVIFDIRFKVYCARERYEFLINVEAQKSADHEKLGYYLENRVVYYLCRMVSAQKYTEFFHSDYDDIKKVFSIWICMDGKKDEDSIDEIRLVRKRVFGNEEEMYTSDLMRGIIIRIRNREQVEESKNELIAMLETLLARQDSEEKKRILENRYGMRMTEELEGRISGMCNLSELIKEEALEEGIEQGIEQLRQQLCEMNRRLAEQGRTDDIIRASMDEEYQKELIREFGL